jgi:hypothetical protein
MTNYTDKLDIRVLVDTTRSGWRADEPATIELSQEQLAEMLRTQGWTLPIHGVAIKQVSVVKLYGNE